MDCTLTLRIGNETLDLGLGSFAWIPPGIVHTFSNRSEQPLRFLNFDTPAGKQDRMRDLAATVASGNPTPEVIVRIHSRHDWRRVPETR